MQRLGWFGRIATVALLVHRVALGFLEYFLPCILVIRPDTLPMRLPLWFTEHVEPVPDSADLRVSTLELFVDLVFVFTATQFTGLLAHDLGHGVPQTLLMFGVIWWMFAGYAWATNSVPPTRPARRLLLLCGMAGWLIVALAVPTAFIPGRVAFALGFLVVVVVHGAMYLQFTTRFLPMWVANLAAVAIIFVAQALTAPPLAFALWAMALLIMWTSPIWVGQEGFSLHPGHIVERHGLVVIVALGESIVAIGIGAADLPVDLGLVTVALLGLALSACLWWSYFSSDLERAEHVLRETSNQVQRTRMVLLGLFYAHMPILLGIVALAAGIEHAIGHAAEPLALGSAALVSGGVALFLFGEAGFRRALSLDGSGARFLLGLLALGTIPVGLLVAAWVHLLVLVGMIVAALTAESRSS